MHNVAFKQMCTYICLCPPAVAAQFGVTQHDELNPRVKQAYYLTAPYWPELTGLLHPAAQIQIHYLRQCELSLKLMSAG